MLKPSGDGEQKQWQELSPFMQSKSIQQLDEYRRNLLEVGQEAIMNVPVDTVRCQIAPYMHSLCRISLYTLY
jgi:hypothetical protein